MDKTDDAVNHILMEMEKKDDGYRYVLVSVHAAKILASIVRDSSKLLTVFKYLLLPSRMHE